MGTLLPLVVLTSVHPHLRARRRARIFLTVLLPDDVRPQAEVVDRGKAEGLVDLLVVMQTAATFDRERPPDGRARVLVATLNRPLALLAAIMGALARLAHLEPRLPTTVARPSLGCSRGRTTGATRMHRASQQPTIPASA